MKKTYLAPELFEVKFETEDTLAISIVAPGSGNDPEVGVEVPLFGKN
jgi:hypothetical protein